MADKNTANIGFEKQIWDAACVLWGHIPAAEYRNVIKKPLSGGRCSSPK
jgi:type I restriction enzyme M protein